MIVLTFDPEASATDTRPSVTWDDSRSLQANATRLPSGDQQASRRRTGFPGRQTPRSEPSASDTVSRDGADPLASNRVPSTRLPSGENRSAVNGLLLSGRAVRVARGTRYDRAEGRSVWFMVTVSSVLPSGDTSAIPCPGGTARGDHALVAGL